MHYLDHAATTPLPRPVADRMYQVLTEQYGNPSSQYPLGRQARALVDESRAVVAGALGCPAEELFFDGTPDKPMDEEQRAGLGNLVEMVRWAPSAVNKQPWRIIKSGEMFHLYKKKDKGYVSEETGDLQKIDIGIALCHLVSGLEEMGK